MPIHRLESQEHKWSLITINIRWSIPAINAKQTGHLRLIRRIVAFLRILFIYLKIILGTMLRTWVLSMWMTNTADDHKRRSPAWSHRQSNRRWSNFKLLFFHSVTGFYFGFNKNASFCIYGSFQLSKLNIQRVLRTPTLTTGSDGALRTTDTSTASSPTSATPNNSFADCISNLGINDRIFGWNNGWNIAQE